MSANIFDPVNSQHLQKETARALSSFTRGLFGDEPASASADDQDAQSNTGLDLEMIETDTDSAAQNTRPSNPAQHTVPRLRAPTLGTLHPAGQRAAVQKFAELLELSPESVAKAQAVVKEIQPGQEMAAITTLTLHVAETVINAHRHSSQWVASKKLREIFNEECMRKIFKAHLQTFSQFLDHKRLPILKSLENQMRIFAHNQSNNFIAEHYPSDYGKANDTEAVKKINIFIKDVLKNMRSKTRNLLLTNILFKKKKNKNLPVPHCVELADQIAAACFGVQKTNEASKKKKSKKNQTDDEEQSKFEDEDIIRAIFMRYVTAHTHINPKANKRHSQWKELDLILARIAKESPAYVKAYLSIVLSRDTEVFNGTNTWDDIKSKTKLPLPTRAEVFTHLGQPLTNPQDTQPQNTQPGDDDEEVQLVQRKRPRAAQEDEEDDDDSDDSDDEDDEDDSDDEDDD